MPLLRDPRKVKMTTDLARRMATLYEELADAYREAGCPEAEKECRNEAEFMRRWKRRL